MNLTITAALRPSRTTTGATHLVVSSPAVPGSSPDTASGEALCGQTTVAAASEVEVWDVDCCECVQLVGPYLALPGWESPWIR